jgi:hypothetical protein
LAAILLATASLPFPVVLSSPRTGTNKTLNGFVGVVFNFVTKIYLVLFSSIK